MKNMNKKNDYLKLGLFLLALTTFFSGQAWTQFQGRLEGVVRDKAGNPLEKVSVLIVSQQTATVFYSLTTDSAGRFAQIGLMPGYFQVSFKKPGFLPRSFEAKVSIAEATKVEVILEGAAEALERNISAADKHFLKGNKLSEEKKYEEAAGAYQEAIKLSQTQWGYYFNLGLAYKKLERREEAEKAFEKARELNPESYSANKELGESLAKMGDFAEAKKFYRKATELSPDDPDAFYNLGICLVNTGENEPALAAFLTAVKLKDDYADAYYQVGTIYVGQNMVKEAVENLEKFLKLAPNHEQAALARNILEYLKK